MATELGSAEHAVGAEPDQFRLLVESVSDYAIYLLDTCGHVRSWNAGVQRIKGYTSAEVLGRHYSIFYTAEDREAGKPQEFLRQAEREGRVRAEGWRVRSDGSRFWADVVVTALRGRAGELIGFAKVTRDMTAIHRALENERLLSAFAMHSPAMLFLKDLRGRYRFVNAQFLQRFGLRREQVVGRSDTELFPRSQATAYSANDARVLERGEAMQFEETARYVDGDRANVVVKFPVRDAAGALVGVGGVATDITERKGAEQALRESRTLLEEAQKVAGLGCWEWDPGSGRLQWSGELYRIYGVDPAGFQPSFEAYLERVHPADRGRVSETVASALIDGRGFYLEERIVRPDGEVRVLRSHGEVVKNERGRALKLLGACFDITEQKAAEERLRAAAETLSRLSRRLVEAEEAERRRIARELHDRVGQNLSALNINLDIVLGMLGEQASHEVRVRLRDSLALVDGTLQTIENVMADLRPPLLDEYGLGAALGWHAEEFVRRTHLRVDFEDRAKERTRALRHEDAVTLFRIAQEALNNAAKHAQAEKVKIRLEVKELQFILEIHDDGRGFDPAAPTGRLGMRSMRERAEAAGAAFQVESAPGQGTLVRVGVPLAQ
jgi:two-component system sensor histidine kinase UhpB